MQKEGYFSRRNHELTWDGTRADATWHARPRGPTRALAWREASANAWQGHASPCGRLGGATWQRVRLAGDGPMD